MKLKNLIAIIFLLPFIASASTLNLKALNKDQLTELFKGKTLTIGPAAMLRHAYVDDSIKMYFAADGKIFAKWLKPLPNTSRTDHGIWWIKDENICVQWQQWGNSCAKFYQLYDNYLVVDQDPGHEAIVILKQSFVVGNEIQ